MIVEYMMHRNELRQLVTPSWVDDGGHFHSADDNTFVGYIAEPKIHYLPDTVLVLTPEQLHQRAQSLHSARPFNRPDGSVFTQEEVTAMVNAWLAGHGEA